MVREKLKELVSGIIIPEELEVEVKNNEIIAKREGKEIRRRFPKVMIDKEENKIVIKTKGSTRREKKQINTIVMHVKNMFKGLKEKFVYKLQICSVHFPMNVSVKEGFVVVKNFLGETKERKAKILPNVEVKVEKEIIIVESIDKEAAGQTAANIEKIARSKNKDTRIFQDGIFLVEKAGRRI